MSSARPALALLILIVGAACATGAPSSGPAGDGGPALADAASLDGGAAGPDAATCGEQPCSVEQRCGCSGGQVCDVDLAAEDRQQACRDVLVPGDESSACIAATGCAEGLTCVAGQCRRYCSADDDCAPAAECLYRVADDGGEPIPELGLCTKLCEPELALANGCPADPQHACRLFYVDPDAATTGGEHFQTDCTAAGDGGDGATCTAAQSECRAGFACLSVTIDGQTTPQCKQLCVYAVDGSPGPRVCEGGRECVELAAPAAEIGTIEYGGCI